jgi:hypothetical protein
MSLFIKNNIINNMINSLYSITLINVSNNRLHSLSTFNDNLLDYWYYDLDNFPKHFLVYALLEVLCPSKKCDIEKVLFFSNEDLDLYVLRCTPCPECNQ